MAGQVHKPVCTQTCAAHIARDFEYAALWLPLHVLGKHPRATLAPPHVARASLADGADGVRRVARRVKPKDAGLRRDEVLYEG